MRSYGNFEAGTPSSDTIARVISMISAFSAANDVVLEQIKTEDKSNEVNVIPELLKLLNLH